MDEAYRGGVAAADAPPRRGWPAFVSGPRARPPCRRPPRCWPGGRRPGCCGPWHRRTRRPARSRRSGDGPRRGPPLGPEGQDALRVDAAAPERDVLPVGSLEAPRVHPPGAHLDGIQDVHPDVDEVGHQVEDGAAAVVEQLGPRLPLDRLEEPALAGLDERDVELGADHPALLRAHVVPEGEDVDVRADLVQVALGRLDVDLGDAVHEPLGERAVEDHRLHEGLEADRPAGLLEDAAADDAGAHEGEVGVLWSPPRPLADGRHDLHGIGLRPAVGLEGLQRSPGSGTRPVVVEAAVLRHPHPGAPPVVDGPVLPVVEDRDAGDVGGRELDHPGVDREAGEERFGEERQLLDLVVDRHLAGVQAEVLHQRHVGRLRDRGHDRAPEVDRDPVRLSMVEGRPTRSREVIVIAAAPRAATPDGRAAVAGSRGLNGPDHCARGPPARP